jgi:deoxyribose-phosphate aldolase
MAHTSATTSLQVRAQELLETVRTLPKPGPAHVTAEPLAAMIDHTLLKAEATPELVVRLCAEAVAHAFASVCVHSSHVPRCAAVLAGSGIPVCAVVGFPLGANLTEVKVYEAARCLALGAQEIDMVLPIGTLRAGDYGLVRNDVAQVAACVHRAGGRLKVILETALLTDAEVVIACLLCREAGADGTGVGGRHRGRCPPHALCGGANGGGQGRGRHPLVRGGDGHGGRRRQPDRHQCGGQDRAGSARRPVRRPRLSDRSRGRERCDATGASVPHRGDRVAGNGLC